MQLKLHLKICKTADEIMAQGVRENDITLSLKAQIRYDGTDTALFCNWSGGDLDLVKTDFSVDIGNNLDLLWKKS